MLSFFPRGVLDEILNLIGSVSEGFPSYSTIAMIKILFVDRISLYFTGPQTNRLKSNNKQAFQLCTASTV